MSGHRPPGNGGSLPFRPPTIDQALRHTPLTSILPFSPETIPFPSAGPPSSSAVFSSPDQRASAQRVLDSLNSEASSQQGTSARLQKTLRDLKQLLNPNELTSFNFKGPPPLPTPPPDSPGGVSASNGSLKSPQVPQLSPFTKMVLANTNVNHRYPTPDSPLGSKGGHRSIGKPLASSPTMLHPQAVAPNRGAVNQNANLGTPKSTLSTPEKVAHVLVPGLTPSSRGDFQSFVHLEEQVPEEQDGVPSKKRKRPQAHEDPLPVTYNQQQKSDRKTDELQAFLNDIFEAEDNYESGPSASLSPAVVKFVDVNFVDGANVVVLQPDTQTRLNALIQPVLEARRFGAISEEDVIRLQNLCRGRVDAIHSGSLQIEAEWNDAELDHWLSKIQDAEYGLGAAKILLKTMTAGRAEKKIYSDDHMVSIIKAMKYSFNGIIPIVESRPTSEVFRMVSDSKQLVSKVLQRCGQVLELLGDLVANIEVSERAVTAIEVLSTKLIFVNNAISEKDSVLGSKRFELIRPIAMDVVSKIFARYEIRRRSSLTDILSSLDKLSVDRRGSRQYKMADGTAIQVVSALLMRLVQTSATISTAQQTGNKTATRSSDTDDEDEEGDSASSSTDDRAPRKKTTNRKRRNISKMGLRDIMMSLHTQMQANADFIVRFIVTRASDTPKSGDLPYRHLLEMFTEDFLSVLGSPKWPAAQAFLSKLIGHMVHILSDAKSTVPAKTMALDVMGFMGSSLIDLELLLKKECQKLDKNQSKLSALLTQLGEQLSEQLSENASKSNPGKGSRADKPSVSTSKIDLLDFEGPYRVVLEHLRGTIRGDELRSAQGCTIQDWAFNLCEVQKSEELQEEENPALLPLQRSLKSMILDPTWLAAEYTFESVSQDHGRLAAVIIALQSPFGQSLPTIMGYIRHSMANPSPTIKARSLKNLELLLDKSPKYLDQLILTQIFALARDTGISVRDACLQLIEKCLHWNPTIEAQCLMAISRLADDPTSSNLRKKAMKILKGIYLRNADQQLKSSIANALMGRIQDIEPEVAQAARHLFEDIWIAPFHEVTTTDNVKLRLALRSQLSLIIQMVKVQPQSSSPLEIMLQNILTKPSDATFRVCKSMVAELFEGVIADGVLPDKPKQSEIIQTLAMFARASPTLFTVEQIVTLQTFTDNIKTDEDLWILWAVLVIFRHVFPLHTTYPENFLTNIVNTLYKITARLRNRELKEVAQCVSIVDGLLKQDGRRPANTILSVIRDIGKAKDDNHIIKRLAIIGYFGAHCKVESRLNDFKRTFPQASFRSVAELIVNTLLPYTLPMHSKTVRRQALESVAMMCQSFPKEYTRVDVNEAFKLVFESEDIGLKDSLLDQFLDVFAQEEKRSEIGAQHSATNGAGKGAEGFNNSLVANEADGVPSRLATNFLGHAIQIALTSTDATALKAAKFIASSNRQGLIVPSDCLPALVALETSPIQAISDTAYEEHKSLWKKNTGMEKEYMNGVSFAFEHQRDIIHDSKGATGGPHSTAKLNRCYDVLCNGELKQRKKFLSNLVERHKFPLSKADTSGDSPRPLHYARFCLENLAFFDYARTDEVMHVVSCMEKFFAKAAVAVANDIEIHVLGTGRLEDTTKQEEGANAALHPSLGLVNGTSAQNDIPLVDTMQHAHGETSILPPADPPTRQVDKALLRHLTVSSMILSVIEHSRRFLMLHYSLKALLEIKTNGKATKGENNKPVVAKNSNGDKYLRQVAHIMTSLDSTDTMLAQCSAFIDLVHNDDDFKIDDDAQLLKAALEGYDTPTNDDTASVPGSGRGRKRKSSLPAGTPRKRKAVGTGRTKGRSQKNRSGSSGTPDGDGYSD